MLSNLEARIGWHLGLICVCLEQDTRGKYEFRQFIIQEISDRDHPKDQRIVHDQGLEERSDVDRWLGLSRQHSPDGDLSFVNMDTDFLDLTASPYLEIVGSSVVKDLLKIDPILTEPLQMRQRIILAYVHHWSGRDRAC